MRLIKLQTLIVTLQLLFLSGCLNNSAAQKVEFKEVFAPSESVVTPYEKPYRDDVCLNGLWKFAPVENAEKLPKSELRNPVIPAEFNWESTPVKIPSPWNINKFARGDGGDFLTYPSYPKKWETVRAGWLMRKIPYKKEWDGKRIILRFEAVMGCAQVFVNRQKVGENFDLFLPFEIDVTDKIKAGEENELLVWVAEARLFDQPGKYGRRTYVGGSFWGDMVTGIWQDVFLIAKPAVHVENTFIKPFVDRDELEVEVTLTNKTSKKQEVTVDGAVMPWINLAGNTVPEAPVSKWKLGETVLGLPQSKVSLEPNASKVVNLKVKVEGRLKYWTAETPDLYGLIVKVNRKKKVTDQAYTRFGWRQVSLAGNKVLLNSKEVVFKGDSWHFMGVPQMTRRYAWGWYKMLKDANANAVRLHAQPYPSFYLDVADEMGIFVLDETGIWASDGGPKADSEEYWKSCEDHVRRLIYRDRNHPSVFGWSVCNENIPVVAHVQHGTEELIQRQLDEINKWTVMAQSLDPSRTWVSGDGETDRPTNLPTVIGHYGNENSYRSWSSQGKVWGVGECGMGYYGSPRQTSSVNGSRSYESMLGRMEAIATEAYKLLNLQKQYGASFLSVFNVIWYGLKPLELGLKDTAKEPSPEDGIFFTSYKEGQPGMQPERLGPYTTTLNPGYDPSLPLYNTWPLFDAVRASFTGRQFEIKPGKNITDDEQSSVQPKHVTRVLVASSDKDSALINALREMGIEVATLPTVKKDENILLIIDGLHPLDNESWTKARQSVLQQGGNVVVWGISPESLQEINKILPYPVELTTRESYSFLTTGIENPITNGLNHTDFYFAELSQSPLMIYGITGEFTNKGDILLTACNTDWCRWNGKAEYLKTAAVLRSERESKPEGNAIVSLTTGKGALYIISLQTQSLFRAASPMLNRFFYNLGVVAKQVDARTLPAISKDGILIRGVVAGSFNVNERTLQEIAQTDFLEGAKDESLYPGNNVRNRLLLLGRAVDGIFDFKNMNLRGPGENAVAYLSFWVYSPRSLTNLLAEPDMPRLDMYIGSDDGHQVYLNGKLLAEDLGQGGLTKKEGKISALPLEKGWNHFMIKAIQYGGEWKIAAEFDCSDKKFLQELKTQVSQ